ncbi:MAG TPA: Ig-like domain repeat protein [Verrucomicrobiota bacterium]|nr:Ig-like domain repeat protein [Verrucomicrobiota bacterium]
MNKFRRLPIGLNSTFTRAVITCCLMLIHSLTCSAGVVVYVNETGNLIGVNRAEATAPQTALQALAAPPAGLFSGVPAGTSVEEFSWDKDGAVVGFSTSIVAGGLDDARLELIFGQVRGTLMQFGIDGAIRLETGGRLLSDYVRPTPVIEPRKSAPAAPAPAAASSSGLAGRSISLSPGHGKVWTGSYYAFERPVYCAPLNCEDDHNLEIMKYLNQYLTQDGAVTKVYRCLNKNYGTHSGSGEPWWRVSAGYWLQLNGYPCSVYASYTGDCTLGSGASESSDSLRSRGLASDYDGTDIYVSLHSNGYQGDCAGTDCPNGTCTYYDTSTEHAAWGAISQTLATEINTEIVDSIRNKYGDTTWRNRGAIDANGNQAETRIPNRAAVLIELAFHDSCDRDGLYLQDNFFRSTTMWATYKGICDYFGVTPTWDYYSDEFVSHDIPASMMAGSTATVHIIFRNRGVLWNDARSFKLGAVGDSDPFTATTRYNVGGEVDPGATKTFTLTFTAPETPGTYTTDWRMLREGVAWFGATLTTSVVVTNASGGPNITTQPLSQTAAPGGTVNFTVAAVGSQPLSYQWRKNAADLSNGGNVSGATTTTLTISNVQQTNAGTYTVLVSNTNDSVLSAEAVLTVGIPGIAIGSYTADWQGNPTQNFPGYVTTCGYDVWYIVDRTTTNCNTRNGLATWNPGFTWNGRGWVHMDFQVPCSKATSQIYVRYRNVAGAYSGQFSTINECLYGDWMTPLDQVTDNLSNYNGCYVNSDESEGAPSGGCNTTCNVRMTGVAQIHMYGSRWHYVNDWTCLGGYASTSVSDTSGRSFAWGETGLYLYPAIDTSHGNVIAAGLGLSGKTPGRVTTGDCNNANTLDFKGNASAYGNGDNMDSYGFAWVFSPAGAAPKVAIGTDDGSRVWINGSLINDNNAARGLTRDQDVTSAVTLPVGWSRVLFKVHNFTGGFQGTMSLRNGGNVNLNEPSVNVFDLGGYYSYGVGYEQDSWYPFVYVNSFCGGGNPAPGADFYGNTTTVTAGGTAIANGPVPLWRVMHYEWGYGLGGDTDYAAVSSGSNTWTHTQTAVTGHRRFHFFAVSKSGRTSFQNNGQTGGANWGGGGAGTYMDVYVDNVPPQNPAFSSATAASPSQVNLAWALPLDQGVGIAAGATEAADEASNSSGNYYRVGDVGARVYRNGSAISGWGKALAAADTGLTPNTQYTYTLEARDNQTETRGSWHNATGQQGSIAAWTLSVPPGAGSVTPDQATLPVGSNVTWTAVSGFGPGQVQYYRYAWDSSPTHTWTDTETQWTSGTLVTVPNTSGTWYLHIKGYNGANVANGAFDYAVTATPPPASATALVSSRNPSTEGSNVTFTATVTAVPPATGTPSGDVVFLANSVPFSTNVLVSGVASASTAALPVGTNTVVAEYAGDVIFTGSSDSLEQVVQSLVACSQTNAIVGIADNQDGTFTLTFLGTPQAQYYVVGSADVAAPMSNWEVLAGSTNTVSNPGGLWQITVTNTAARRYYRSTAVAPCP